MMFARVADNFGARPLVGLALDARAIRLNRSNAEHQLVGDLGVRVPMRDQLQHFQLAFAETVRRARQLLVIRSDPAAKLWVAVALAVTGRSRRIDEFAVGR